MRILIANKFYYRRGGDCIYSLDLERILQEAGHQVAFFAMEYSENFKNSWSKYWPSEVSFSVRHPRKMLRAFVRPFGDHETVQKFSALLDDFKPDVVHVNNIHTQLSPIIAEIAHARGIKVVWTLHDYKLICPAYTLFCKGQVCEKCIHGNKINCRKNKCVKGNFLASFIAQKEAEMWNAAWLEKNVDAYVCPSHFMKQKMEQGGFNPTKLHVLHNFMDTHKIQGPKPLKRNHYCYVGRLAEEKGIRTLLSVASLLPYTLKVLGSGPLESELRLQYRDAKNIEFMGHCTWEICKKVVSESIFSVIPSEWYENNPLSVIESLNLGTPVLGANIGGIPELIRTNVNGILFESGNRNSLLQGIQQMFIHPIQLDGPIVELTWDERSYLKNIFALYSSH